MRKVLYAIILAFTLCAPVKRVDIAKLQPVEAVAIYYQDGLVVLTTDDDSIGRGPDADSALENLKENTAAIVYLDTAEYLLIGLGAEDAAASLRKHLKKTVQTGIYCGGDVKQEAKYLDVHLDSAKPAG